jgi:hypothetical protein
MLEFSGKAKGGDMKVFNIRDFYNKNYKEYIIGSKELGKHSVYLVYGEVSGGEKREMAPGGHDEIVFMLEGDALFENSDTNEKMTLKKEEAIYLDPEQTFLFAALTDCRYVVAGTHTVPHAH